MARDLIKAMSSGFGNEGKSIFKIPSNKQANQIAKQNGYAEAHDLKKLL
jgi:hypothetical protein